MDGLTPCRGSRYCRRHADKRCAACGLALCSRDHWTGTHCGDYGRHVVEGEPRYRRIVEKPKPAPATTPAPAECVARPTRQKLTAEQYRTPGVPCPSCGSTRTKSKGIVTYAGGVKMRRIFCSACRRTSRLDPSLVPDRTGGRVDRAEVARMHAEDMSDCAIADALGVSKQAIWQIRKALELPSVGRRAACG